MCGARDGAVVLVAWWGLLLRGRRQKRICMLRLVASPLSVFVDMKSAAHFVLSLSRLSVFIYRMLQIGSRKASHIEYFS